MQQIAIEPVGVEPGQRTLAGGDGAAPRGIAWQNLRNQESLIAPPGDGFRHDEFGIAIHLRGIDVDHAEIDAPAQRRDRAFAIATIDIPGALPDHGHLTAGVAE